MVAMLERTASQAHNVAWSLRRSYHVDMHEEGEVPDGLSSCPECGRYMTSDRQVASMPSAHPAPNDGTMHDPLPAVYARGRELTCQPCAYQIISERLVELGVIVAQGECATCDTWYWAKPTLDPGGPVGRHCDGAAHGRTHCTCGRPGCASTD